MEVSIISVIHMTEDRRPMTEVASVIAFTSTFSAFIFLLAAKQIILFIKREGYSQ